MERLEIALLLALAAAQHGVFSTQQARQLGISPTMLRKAVARGWLRCVRRGVYAVAGVPPSKWQPLMAAALAAGTDAAISHRSAGTVHGLHGILAPQPELTLPHGPGRHLDGVRVHQSRDLSSVDIEVRHSVRVTAPIRTVIDLAPTVTDHLLGEILDEGAISRLWTAELILDRLARLGTRGRPGSERLRQLLALRMGEGYPHSRLEQHLWRVLRPNVRPFVVHHAETIDGERIEMDVAWLEDKIDGEVDGMAVRAASRTKFERQCRRENLLTAHGWRIVHFTAQMDDATILAQVAPLLPGRLVRGRSSNIGGTR